MTNWRNYLGLPHVFGADPADGQGADCLIMTFNILDALGLPHPAFEQRWLELAKACRWGELLSLWDEATVPLDAPENGAVTLIQNGKAGLGVAIVVDDGVLMVHHRRGVVWIPLQIMKPLTYCRFV